MVAWSKTTSCLAVVLVGAIGAGAVWGQPPRAGAANRAAPPKAAAPAPQLKETALPVNPTDPIAVVNGQVITRRTLADECVARNGKEILETLVNRVLIEQAIAKNKLQVTAAEIDAEIDAIAHRMAGVSREGWLRVLERERNISPAQYARDIIYPMIALRKLAEPRIKITEDDLREAFDAQYGDKLRCRIIMVDKLRTAQELWGKLQENPGGFEKLAMESSMDLSTKSMGGLIAEPIARHSYPRAVSDAAFQQLVDGDPKDTDPKHKPKDGDFTGPIQVADTSWIILKREQVIPAQGKDANDPKIKDALRAMVQDAKLKEEMGLVFNELAKAAEIENRLTGNVKMANQEAIDPEETTATPPAKDPNVTATGGASSETIKVKTPIPAGVAAEEVKRAEQLKKPAAGQGRK